MTDMRFGMVLRRAGRRAWDLGVISETGYEQLRKTILRASIINRDPDATYLLETIQSEVIEEAHSRGLCESPTAIPKKIDCEALIQLLIQFLPMFFG